jgi:dihydroorotate dehydrogenase
MLEAGASLVALNTGLRTNGMRLLKAAANGLTTETKTAQ